MSILSHFKLFEDYNPYDGPELTKKLHLYARASESSYDVANIEQNDKHSFFDFHTKIPSDFRSFGFKKLEIKIPHKQMGKALVITHEGTPTDMKQVLVTTIEIPSENNLEVILMNFLEATLLYDDNVVQVIVDACQKIRDVTDIQKMTAKLTPDHDTDNS